MVYSFECCNFVIDVSKKSESILWALSDKLKDNISIEEMLKNFM